MSEVTFAIFWFYIYEFLMYDYSHFANKNYGHWFLNVIVCINTKMYN